MILLLEILTVETVLSSLPPTEPIDKPCPPVQLPPVKTMFVPELIARQSSWLCMTALEMVTPVDVPTSN
jgi:hypothetical protein